MKIHITLLLLIILLLPSCGQVGYELTSNMDIDEHTRNEINDLDIKLFQHLKDGDYEACSKLMSARLSKQLDPSNAGSLWERMHSSLEGKSYMMGDEYHVKGLLAENSVKIEDGEGLEAYTYTLHTHSSETELSFMRLGDANTQYLLAAQYGKINGKWLLDGITIGMYAVLNKTAPAYYQAAKKYYEDGSLVDAKIMIGIYEQCSKPADSAFIYTQSPTMDALERKIANAVEKHFSFPYTITSITTRPQVLNIMPVVFKGRLYEKISYLSTIRLQDTIALKKENEEIHGMIGKLYHGLDQNHDTILYRAFNTMPAGTKPPDSYNFIQKVKK